MTDLLQILAAGIGTVAFGALFGVPSKYYPYCGLIGASGWAVYVFLWMRTGFWSEAVVVFLATVLVILMSRFFAVRERCPVTILICGILPLVPGAGIYWTCYYLVTGQLDEASTRGFSALKAAVAIVLGIVFVFEIPQRFFRERRSEKMTNCEACAYYSYDEDYECYICEMDLDEDEMLKFLSSTFDACPYYRSGDEYSVVRHQM